VSRMNWIPRERLVYVQENWYNHSLFNEKRFEGSSRSAVVQIAADLDAVFMIRLFAAFEGILRQHMVQHHPNLQVSKDIRAGKDVTVSNLTDQVATVQSVRITLTLCNEVHEVRKYRNSLVHPDSRAVAEVTFTEALARLARYVGWLPDPR